MSVHKKIIYIQKYIINYNYKTKKNFRKTVTKIYEKRLKEMR